MDLEVQESNLLPGEEPLWAQPQAHGTLGAGPGAGRPQAWAADLVSPTSRACSIHDACEAVTFAWIVLASLPDGHLPTAFLTRRSGSPLALIVLLAPSHQVDKTFQVVYTDPWLLGDKHRTSRTISLMQNRTSGALIHSRTDAAAASSSGAPSDTVLLSRLSGGAGCSEWAAREGGRHCAAGPPLSGGEGGRVSETCCDTPLI